MGKELVEASAPAQQVFDRVGSALSFDPRALCWGLDEDTLRQTQNAQMALYLCGVAAWRALEASLPETMRTDIRAMAGHSIGEYAALASAGIVDIETGAKLVQTRGSVMAKSGVSQPGTMAAVLGLDRGKLEAICADTDGIVVVANDNCPGQLVISGEVEAVRKAGEAASAAGAKRVLPLNVSGAFHSPLMEEPAREMAIALGSADFKQGSYNVYANVTAKSMGDQGKWPVLLEDQLRNPVRWTESVQNMIADGVDIFIECGGGDVLSGLIRRIDKGVRCLKVADAASLSDTVAALTAVAVG